MRGFAERVVAMGSIEGTVALVIGIAVALFVPVLVWVMVIAGLRQIVRDKIQETQSSQSELVQEVQQPTVTNQHA